MTTIEFEWPFSSSMTMSQQQPQQQQQHNMSNKLNKSCSDIDFIGFNDQDSVNFLNDDYLLADKKYSLAPQEPEYYDYLDDVDSNYIDDDYTDNILTNSGVPPPPALNRISEIIVNEDDEKEEKLDDVDQTQEESVEEEEEEEEEDRSLIVESLSETVKSEDIEESITLTLPVSTTSTTTATSSAPTLTSTATSSILKQLLGYNGRYSGTRNSPTSFLAANQSKLAKRLLSQIESVKIQTTTDDFTIYASSSLHQNLSNEEQATNSRVNTIEETNKRTTLDLLIDVYNSELDYIRVLKKAFEIYAEPLRKFTSITHDESHLLFSYLEPIISLSYNLSIKLEKLIKSWPSEIGNSGKLLFGKKLFQSYDEYLAKYPNIIKLLDQKLKENEIREFCKLRQTNSDCSLPLKDILSLPLERIEYYEKVLKQLKQLEEGLDAERESSSKGGEESSSTKKQQQKQVTGEKQSSRKSSLQNAFKSSPRYSHQQRPHRFSLAPAVNFYRASGGRKYEFARKRFSNQYDQDDLVVNNSTEESSSLSMVKSSGVLADETSTTTADERRDSGVSLVVAAAKKKLASIPSSSNSKQQQSTFDFSSPSLVFWQKMKEKSQSLINLNNQQQQQHQSNSTPTQNPNPTTTQSSRLTPTSIINPHPHAQMSSLGVNSTTSNSTSLAHIQDKFPNDDLKLFEQHNRSSSSSASKSTSFSGSKFARFFQSSSSSYSATGAKNSSSSNNTLNTSPLSLIKSKPKQQSSKQHVVAASTLTTVYNSNVDLSTTTADINNNNNKNNNTNSKLSNNSSSSTNTNSSSRRSSSSNNNNNKDSEVDSTSSSSNPNTNTNTNELINTNNNSTTTSTTNPIIESSTSSSSSSETTVGRVNNNSPQRSTPPQSFVSKHLLIQRRKTIHDIINLDSILNTLTIHKPKSENSPSQQQQQQQLLTSSTISSNSTNSTTSSTSVQRSNTVLKSTNKSVAAIVSAAINAPQPTANLSTRELLKQGPVLLLNQYGKQDRYLFLFNDLLIIAKQKNENHNKLKHRVVLNEIWIDDSANSIASYFGVDSHCFTAESSFVIGWPPATNYIVDFKDTFVRDDWFRLFKELIEAGKRKDKEIHLNIKISFNRDTFGASEPTQYSQSYTKTIQVKSNETAQEIVNRCKSLFNLDHPNELSNKPQTDSYSSTTPTCDYQLWLKTDKNEPLVPLIGHEYPFAIKMNYLRESTSVGGVGDDTNSCKFILIDKNSPSAALLTGTGSNIRLASTSSNGSNNSTKKMQQQQSPQSNNKENSHQQMLFNNGSSNLMTASANSKTSEPSTVESSTTTNSSGGEKMQKLFKKKAALFWTTNHQTNSNSNSNSSALKSSQQNINNNNIESSSTTINQQNKVNSLSTQHINKIETHKKNSFERDLYRLHHHPNSMLTHANRSNSLHYVSGLQQNAAPNPAASTTTTLSYRASSKPPTSESNSTSNKPSSLPFYNRLKKVHHSHAPHLFGSRLEKICGPFHPETNCRLPSSIMSLMEKVAVEGASSLMIFRKSASAKLKKTYKDKLDTNSAVDFNDMNVHVAALLLKEYMREYPDGIVDYHVYTDCMQSAASSGSNDTAASTTHRLKTTRHLLSTRLSKWNYTLLRHFMCLFAHIASHAHLNKMDAHNISVCVAPSMFHKLDRPNDVESSFKAIAFVEFLINNIEALFGPDTLSLLPSSSVSSSDNPQQEIVIQPAIQPQPAYTQEPVNEPVVAKTTGKAHQTKKEFGGRVLNLVGLKSRTVKSTRSVSKSSSKSNKPTATVAATTPAINQVQSAVDTKNETHDFDDGLRPINRDENEENDQLRSTDMDFKFKRHFNNHNVEKRRRTSTNISTNKSNTAAETVVGMREQQTPQLQQQQPPKLVIEIDHEEERIVAENEEKTRRFKSVTTRGNDDQLIGEHDEVDVDIIEDDEDIDDDGIDDDDDDNELFQKVDVSLKKRPSNKNKTSTMESTSGGGETTRWLSVMAAKRASAQTKDSTANVSSNTLSADSGVSVPVTTTATSNGAATTTATNNDLSSLSNHHRRSNAESSSTSSQNNSSSNSSSNENLLAACGGSSNALPSSSSSTSSSTSSQHYLRRQKRMMALFAATNESSSVASHPPPIPSPPQRHYDDEEEEIEDDDDEDDEVVDEDEDLTDLTKPSNEVVSTAAPNHIDVHSSVNSHYYHRLLPQKQQSNPIQPTSQRNHLNLMKQFSESDALYLDYSLERSSDNNSSPSSNTNDHHNHHENNNNEHYTNKNPYCSLDRCYYNRQQQKRNSIKSFAPLAPTLLLKHAEPQQQPQQMTLVPYETEHVPVNYLRAVEQSTTYNYLSLQLEHRHSKQEQKQKQAPKLDSLVTSASSLLDSKSTSTNPATKSAKSNRTSRRSVVKISLEPSSSSSTSSSSMLFMDAVHTGLGLAANSIGVNTSLGSSSSNNTTTTTATTNTASQHSSSTNSSSSSLNIVINEDKSSPSTSSTSQHQQSSSKVYITYSPNSTSQKQAVAKNPILSNSNHSSLVINTTNKLYPERNARVDQIAQIGSTNASNTMIVKRSVSLRNERPFGSNPFKYNHMFFSNNSRALNEEEGNSTAQTAAETATKVLPPTSYGNNAQQHHHRFISKVYSNIAASPHQHPNCGLSDRVFEKHSASSSRIQQHHDLFAGFLPSRLNQANPTTTTANNNTGGSFNNKSKMVADHLNNAIHSATSIISTSSTSSVSSVTSISNQGNIKQSHVSESTKQPQQSSSSTLNLVDVTWSVPHIRKQFEEKAQQQQQQDNSTNEFSTSSSNSTMSLLTPTASQSSSGFKLVKINRSNTVRAAASGTVTTSTTTTSSSVDHQSTGFIRFYNDINGNPTTYI